MGCGRSPALRYGARDEEPASATATSTLDDPALDLGTVTLVANNSLEGDASLYDADGDGWAACGTDCDDASAATHPSADEVCDGADEVCDGTIDKGTARYDDDGDGQTELAGDCDDSDPSTYLAAPELADWVDNDCDGSLDEGTVNADDDGDGYAEIGGDCDDTRARVNPSATEVNGDGLDNDCDGVTR